MIFHILANNTSFSEVLLAIAQ
jgi:hypothetical protein